MTLPRPKLTLTKCLDGLNLTYIFLAAILFFALAGGVFTNHTFEKQRREARLMYCDFAKYYVCGKIALGPDRQKAYDARLQADYLVRYAFGDEKQAEEFIHYPPMDFPLMAPLATLPIEECFLAFLLIGAATFTTGTFLLSRAGAKAGAGFNSINAIVFFWLAVFGSVPMLRAFALGQTSLFLTGITAIYLFAMLKDRPFLAGLSLALTSIKPQYSVFLVMPALAQKRYKIIFAAAICELIMLGAAAATIGFSNIINYPQIVLHAEQTSNLAGGFTSEMVNVRGLLAIVLADNIAVKIAAVVAACTWLYLGFLWWKFARPSTTASSSASPAKVSPHKIALLLSITVLYCLTFSPHTHLYDCLILSVCAPSVGQSTLRASLAGLEHWSAKLLSLMLILYPAAGWIFLFMPGPGGSFRTAPFAIYNLILCATATLALYNPGKLEPPPGESATLDARGEWL